MHLIIFATLMEAEAALVLFQAKEIEAGFYSSSIGNILITGMGSKKTKETLLRYSDKTDHFINFGIAGALRKEVNSSHFHEIAQVSGETASDCIQLQPDGLHLLTVNKPLYDAKKRDQLAQHHDLVDMEGYVIAKLAKSQNKRCSLYKMVSDFCDQNTQSDIMKKLPFLSQALAEQIDHLRLS